MRYLFVIFVAIIAFAAGVWYTGGFEAWLGGTPPQTSVTPPDSHGSSSPTNTPQAHATYVNADADDIQVTNPQPGAAVPATFSISGKARGGWYFEASFPYRVVDADGTTLAEGPVQADGDWMTSDFVPFSFSASVSGYHGAATLILRNDNPSGMPENDKSVSIPITIQ